MGSIDHRRRIALGVLLAIATMPVAVAPAAATGLIVHPGESIQAAVDAAKPGDTVVVLPGTYREAVCVTTDGIDLRGEGAVILPPAEAPQTPCAVIPAGIILAGQIDFATGNVADPITDVRVSGFRVKGFEASGILLLGGEDVDIVENTAIDNEEYGIARFFSTGGTMRANRATGSEEAGLYLGDSPNANATIVGNTAWDNGFFGIFVRDSSHGSVVGQHLDRQLRRHDRVRVTRPRRRLDDRGQSRARQHEGMWRRGRGSAGVRHGHRLGRCLPHVRDRERRDREPRHRPEPIRGRHRRREHRGLRWERSPGRRGQGQRRSRQQPRTCSSTAAARPWYSSTTTAPPAFPTASVSVSANRSRSERSRHFHVGTPRRTIPGGSCCSPTVDTGNQGGERQRNREPS